MITLIRNGHAVSHPVRELTLDVAEQVVAGLAQRHIYVAAWLGPEVEIEALTGLSTAQEVAALAAFRDVTDCRLNWRKAGAS